MNEAFLKKSTKPSEQQMMMVMMMLMKMLGLLVSWTQFTSKLQNLQLIGFLFVCFPRLLSRQSTEGQVLTPPSLELRLHLLFLLILLRP